MSLETLSDYTWPVLRYIAATPPHRFSARVITAGLSQATVTLDNRFVYRLLTDAAFAGLCQSSRPGHSSAWLWELTPDGRGALADRATVKP